MAEDLLNVVPVPAGQEWALYSELLSLAEEKHGEVRCANAIRFLGAYPTREAADQAARELQKLDPHHNIMLMQSGYWCYRNPASDDKNITVEYADQELNRLMKAHLEHAQNVKKDFVQRKENLVEKEMLMQVDRRFELKKKLLKKREKDGKISPEERKAELARYKAELDEEKKRIQSKQKTVDTKREKLQKLSADADAIARRIEELEKANA